MASNFVEEFEYSEDVPIGDLHLSEDEGEDLEDTDAWKVDLEEALLEGFVDQSMVKSICRLRVLPPKHRTEVWRICLNIASRGDPLSYWNGELDLPEQDAIHAACEEAVNKFSPTKAETTLSDLESIITFYMKSRAMKFDGQNSWLDLMRPILALEEMNRADMYNCFYAILTRYVPKDDMSNTPYDLFRHILMYHDPELCCFIDSKKILMQDFMKPWLTTMFASRCDIEVTLSLWDIYFQEADPFFGLFLSLVVLINAKIHIVAMKDDPKDKILENLTQYPSALQVEDIEDFFQLAMYFRSMTPQSAFRRYQSLYGGMLLNSQKGATKKENEVAESLCLQVSTEDIFTLKNSDEDFENDPDKVKFFLVDCRHPDFYNDGHLHSAHHLDVTLMLREPKEFSMAIDSLFLAQKQAIEAGNTEVGEHVCLIGSGDNDEDQHLHMTIAFLLKNQHAYVSVVHGGFDAIVTYLTQANVKLSGWITGTSQQIRKIRDGQSSGRSSDQSDDQSSSEKGVMEGFMKSFTATIKTKSQDLKTKVSKFMDSEQGMMDWNSSKPYRGVQPIFSIGDEEEQGAAGSSDAGQRATKADTEDDYAADGIELKTLDEWKETYNIENVYPCFKVLSSGKRPAVCIAVKGDDLICLRESKKYKKYGIVSTFPLSAVSKITSKKNCAEMITFRFQIGEEDVADRYLIPDAGIAMKKIKQEIMRVLEGKEE